MALAFDTGDLDQRLLIDDGRAAQQRPGDRYLVLARQLPDEAARRVGKDRQPLGQIGTGRRFGVRNQVDQNAVEQIDVIGPEARSPEQK